MCIALWPQVTIFQQDNTPCHKAKVVKWFHEKDNELSILPDLNPIEDLRNVVEEDISSVNEQLTNAEIM